MIQCVGPALSALKSLICLPLMIAGVWTAPSETTIKHYYVNGAVCQVYHYKNGVPDGQAKEYYEDGVLASECFIAAGKRDGPYTFYYHNGAVDGIIYFRNNRKEWMRRYNKMGTLKEELWYKNGGISHHKLYDEKGKLLASCDVSNTQKTGR